MSTTVKHYPNNLNFLSSASATITLLRIPNVVYFTQQIPLPGINLGVANFPGIQLDQPIPGDNLTFDDFTMTFKVDEDLSNYLEIQEWMRGLGFPYSQDEYGNLIKKTNNQQPNPSTVARRSVLPDANSYSDASMVILNNNNHPILDVTFIRMFPIGLSGLEFTTTDSDTTDVTATATFKYAYYTFRSIKDSKTILPELSDPFSDISIKR